MTSIASFENFWQAIFLLEIGTQSLSFGLNLSKLTRFRHVLITYGMPASPAHLHRKQRKNAQPSEQLWLLWSDTCGLNKGQCSEPRWWWCIRFSLTIQNKFVMIPVRCTLQHLIDQVSVLYLLARAEVNFYPYILSINLEIYSFIAMEL